MNNDITLGRNSFRFWYYRFKDSPYYSLSIIALAVLIGGFLLVRVVIPQITEWFSLQEEVIAKREQIAVLERNISLLGSLDEQSIDKNLTTATTALPAKKDFAGILRVLSDSSVRSGVSLNDYAFQVGNISSESARPRSNKAGNLVGIDTIRVSVSISGSVSEISSFLTIIYQSVPLAEVVQMEGSGQSMNLLVDFYYKPRRNVAYRPETPLAPIAATDQTMLDQLFSWQQEMNVSEESVSSGTSSSIPLF